MIPINNIQATTMLMKKILSRGKYGQLSTPEYYIAAIFEKSHYDSDAYNKMAKDAVQMVNHTLTYWEVYTHKPIEKDKAQAINAMLERHIQSLGHMNMYEIIRTNIFNWSIRQAGTDEALSYTNDIQLLSENVSEKDTLKASVNPSTFYGMDFIELLVKRIDKQTKKITLVYKADQGPINYLSLDIEQDGWVHLHLLAPSVDRAKGNNLIGSYDYYSGLQEFGNSYMQLIEQYFKDHFADQFNLLRQRINNIAALNAHLENYEKGHVSLKS